MTKELERTVRAPWLQGLVIVTGALVILLAGVFLAREYSKVATFVQMGDIWSFFDLGREAPAEIVEVDRDDFLGPPYPQVGDSLVTVGRLPATAPNYFEVFNPDTDPGTRVPLTFKRGEELFETVAVTRSIPAPLRLQVVSLYVLRTLLTVALIVVGFWAFVRRPHSPPVRMLTLFCFSLAASMLIANLVMAEGYARFDIPLGELSLPLLSFFSLFAPAFWVRLHMQFPLTHPLYARHRRWLNAVLFLLPVVLAALFLRPPETARQQIPLWIYRDLLLALGFILLVSNYRRASSLLIKRQTWLVLMGSVPGLALYALIPWGLLLFGQAASGLSMLARLYAFNFVFLLMLLVPLTYAYAFERYRLLEVQGRLKRGTRFVAVNAILLAVFAGTLYLVGTQLVRRLAIESQAPTLALGLALAIGFVPAQRGLRHFLEERFYPERRRLRALLRDYLEAPGRAVDPDAFWEDLCGRLAGGLDASGVFPLLRDGARGKAGVLEADPLPDRQRFFARLGDVGYPLFIDEMIASRRFDLSKAQIRWLTQRRGAVLLPLRTPGLLVGCLLLGRKAHGEDYSTEELELLRSLAGPIALTAENIQLMEDRLARQKLEQQLAVGRQIQERLLPGRLPEAQNLELAARIRFSLDVAGDYYDVLPLEDGSTLLAIGDVAGKGVGAALLMANLQASLRSEKHVGMSLARVVSKINASLCAQIPPELFITFAVGLYDPATGVLRFVNAGHNAPVVTRRDGRIERLEIGGLVLGVDPRAGYEEGVVQLAPGDALLMFTDGVSEAENDAGEHFGEERICELTCSHRDATLSDCLNRIEAAATEFQGRDSFDDDFTMLAMRVTA